MCGSKEIDGYAFCLGVDSLKEFYEARPDLQSLIRSVTYLIREAIFRPAYSIGSSGRSSLDSSGRSSLDICPLGELMDMYHAHGATKRHDKVYALLGMSSDDLSKVDLLPNYRVPWEELLQRLAKYLLSEEISVETWGDREIAVIKSKGCVLGKVSSVRRDTAWGDRQGVDVILKNILAQPGCIGESSAYWTLQASANPVQDGDLICLLQGASKPTIIRVCKDHFAIIMITATPPDGGYTKWPKLSPSEKFFNRDFLLIWDWENSFEKLQDLEHEALIRTNNRGLEHSELELGGHLGKATRTWNVALILGDLGEYREAEERHQEAVKGYEIVFGEKDSYTLGGQYGQTPLLWAAGNGYDTVVGLLLTNDGTDPDLKDSLCGQAPLSWAAKGGHEAVVKLLLKTGKVNVDSKDTWGKTPLLLAAKGGHEAVVKLLLEMGKVDADSKDSQYGRTPLFLAARGGHEAVVKLLLETGKVNVDLKDSTGETPLTWAALRGHEAVIKLLLKTGKVDFDLKVANTNGLP
jgi:ankyrin repeat protein